MLPVLALMLAYQYAAWVGLPLLSHPPLNLAAAISLTSNGALPRPSLSPPTPASDSDSDYGGAGVGQREAGGSVVVVAMPLSWWWWDDADGPGAAAVLQWLGTGGVQSPTLWAWFLAFVFCAMQVCVMQVKCNCN